MSGDEEGNLAVSRFRVNCFSMSLDGFGAGPDQSIDNPLGVGGTALHEWVVPTHSFRTVVLGENDGATGPDNDFFARGFENIGAWIIGRNMFGPIRGEWRDDSWKGWWGDDPPYHADVFVLTHYPREPIEMKGGTVFYFVTDGIRAALERARSSAGEKDVRLGGGVSTIRRYLQAGLIDEMHVAITPALLGEGEHLLHGIDLLQLGYRVSAHVTTENATHMVLAKQA